MPKVTSFTKPGRPPKALLANSTYCEYALVAPGWLPAHPSALRSRTLFSSPGSFSRSTYDAESFGNACHRSAGANVLEASKRTAAVRNSLFHAASSCCPKKPSVRSCVRRCVAKGTEPAFTSSPTGARPLAPDCVRLIVCCV